MDFLIWISKYSIYQIVNFIQFTYSKPKKNFVIIQVVVKKSPDFVDLSVIRGSYYEYKKVILIIYIKIESTMIKHNSYDSLVHITNVLTHLSFCEIQSHWNFIASKPCQVVASIKFSFQLSYLRFGECRSFFAIWDEKNLNMYAS